MAHKPHKHNRNKLGFWLKGKTVGIVTAFVFIGLATLLLTSAQTNTASLEPCSGTVNLPAICAGGAVTFGKSVVPGVPIGQLHKNVNPLFEQLSTKTATQLTSTLSTNGLLVGQNPQFEFFKFNGGTANREGGQFRTWCQFSHLSYDDPIVYPGQFGKSHLHMYFGNTATDANSSVSSIINSGGSTCEGGALNRTSYWLPAVIDTNGKARIPNQMILYYKNEGVPMPTTPVNGYSPIPPGLKMIAGDPKATVPRNNNYNDGWVCGGGVFTNPNSYPDTTKVLIPTCSGNNTAGRNKLSQKLLFPRCWDGVIPNPNETALVPYVAHVVYPDGYNHGRCDSGHPYVFPEISLLMEWELAPNETTAGWRLSSDMNPALPGGITSHGDYYAGWNDTIVKAWTNDCLNTEWNCQTAFISNKAGSAGAPGGALPGGSHNALRGTAQDQFAGKGPIIYSTK